MKNLFLGLIITFFLANDSFGQVISGGSVQVTWSIGRRSRDCNSFGFCKSEKITIKLDSAPVMAPHDGPNRDFYAKTSVDNSGKIKIEVNQKNMDLIQFYEGAKKIIIEESYTIEDANILKDLNIKPYKIEAGEYLFDFDKNTSTYVLYL